jgi:hypothetical protein
MLSTLPFQVSLFSVIRVHDAAGKVIEHTDRQARSNDDEFRLFCHRITGVGDSKQLGLGAE